MKCITDNTCPVFIPSQCCNLSVGSHFSSGDLSDYGIDFFKNILLTILHNYTPGSQEYTNG